MNVHYVEQPVGDLVLPCFLRSVTGQAYIHNPTDTQNVTITIWNPELPGPSGTTATLLNLTANGLSQVTILEDDLPTGLTRFHVLLVSPTSAFQPHQFYISFEPKTVQELLGNMKATDLATAESVNEELAALKVALDDILIMAEANIEKVYTWNVDKTRIEQVDIFFKKDDAATDYQSTPDKHMRITYTYDNEGRAVSAKGKEVGL